MCYTSKMCEEICTDDLKQLFEKIFVAGFTVKAKLPGSC
jgi:hypothetical protein